MDELVDEDENMDRELPAPPGAAPFRLRFFFFRKEGTCMLAVKLIGEGVVRIQRWHKRLKYPAPGILQ